MAKLWRKTTDSAGKPAVQELDLSGGAPLTSPTVIYLSGFLTTDKKPEAVLEGAGFVEDMLARAEGSLKAKPDVLVWSHTKLSDVFHIASYNMAPNKAWSANAEKLARGVFLPLVTGKDGQPLPAEEARRNLRNITLFGYSAGTVLAQETFNATLHLMQKAGYKEDAARGLLKEVVLISTANMSNPPRENNRFTAIYLASGNDFFVRWRNRIWNPIRMAFSRFSRKLSIKKLSDSALLVTAAIRHKLWHWTHKPDGTHEKKRIDPQLPEWTGLATRHELPHYTTGDASHNAFAHIALNALVNAVNRDATPDVLKLLEPTSATPAAELQAYRDKIAKALPKKKAA